MKPRWELDLKCGCTIQAVVKGISQVAMHDSVNGFCVKCPEHGWTLQVYNT